MFKTLVPQIGIKFCALSIIFIHLVLYDAE